MRTVFLLSAALWCGITQAQACLTPDQAREVVPKAEQQIYDDVQDLTGPAYKAFLKILSEGLTQTPDADEAMVFYYRQVGHSADIGMVWFKHGCAIQKGSYPAQFWQAYLMQGKGS